MCWPALFVPATSFANGAMVESVSRFSAAERAGIEPGDVLVSWRAADDATAIASPFHVQLLEIEHPRHAPYRMTLDRAGTEFEVTITPGRFGIAAVPIMSPDAHGDYSRALDRGVDYDESVVALDDLANRAEEAGRCHDAAWFRIKAERQLRSAGRSTEAEARETATRQAECIHDAEGILALISEMAGATAYRLSDFRAAETKHLEALSIRLTADGDGLAAARSYTRLAKVVARFGDGARAREYGLAAVEIYANQAPDSLELAEAYHQLGNNEVFVIDDLDQGDAYHSQALAIRSIVEPGGRDEAISLGSLSTIAWRKDELIRASALAQQALTAFEALDPESGLVGAAAGTLGNIEFQRRNFATAEQLRRRALEILERERPGSLGVAHTLMGLGAVQRVRGDFDGAMRYYERAKDIYQQLGAQRNIALLSIGIGNLALESGDRDAARAAAEEALAMFRELGADGTQAARTLLLLGETARQEARLDDAITHLGEAADILDRIAPGGLTLAQVHYGLARTYEELDRDGDAWEHLDRALTIGRRLAPGTLYEALPLHRQGVLTREAGEIDSAVDLFARALDAFEAQRLLVGGTDLERSQFASGYKEFYVDFVDALLELGREEQAFHVLERYRARVLLAMWAERSPVVLDLPGDLRERQGQVHRGYRRTLDTLREASDREQEARLLAELDDWRAEREQLAREIRATAPQLAAIEYPEPLTADEVTQELATETLVLSYFVTPDRTWLFSLSTASGRASLAVHTLDLGEDALSDRVDSLRTLIRLPDAREDVQQSLRRQSHMLFEDLLGAVVRDIDAASRILIVPDGALHVLPFAALVRNPPDANPPRYLIEDVPIHGIVSLTTYTLLDGRGAGDSESNVLVLANPTNTVAGGGLAPLPGAESEANSIATLYPDRVEAYLHTAATEERARLRAPAAEIAHFATHGVLDARRPLDSYLLLAPEPSGDPTDNGLLHAWEIVEGLRIDADLVTLSGCDTYLGREAGGEGLIGLTRAFHYAGARSVLASLWRVSDDAAPILMGTFYQGLADGLRRDEALRRAQLELIRDEAPAFQRLLSAVGLRQASPHSHPYYWAAFQLSGAVD